MNVLLIGGGGREHALAWALAKAKNIGTLYCAPGNAGIAQVAICTTLNVNNVSDVTLFCRTNEVSIVVVGPEAPLVDGLVDALEGANIKAFGPSGAAAQLEGSKGFTKAFCSEFGIPTAAYERFDSLEPALAYVAGHPVPVVIKADGLASGKGVVVAETRDEAEAAVKACFAGAFGAAGASVVIEEFLEGEEASLFVLSDGQDVLAFGTAQDHKRVGDGDTGPNTGGMGAYSPASVITDALHNRVMAEIIEPTIAGMAKRGTPYRGVLFAGLMLTAEGPKLIEYNVRFGDPEAQVLMMRLKSDLLEAMLACIDGGIGQYRVAWHDEVALTVVMAANGYPASPQTGSEIKGLEAAAALEGVHVFHAGTRRQGDRVISAGGRVLNVTAVGKTINDAQSRAYEAVGCIDWPEGFCRSDIGWRELARQKA